MNQGMNQGMSPATVTDAVNYLRYPSGDATAQSSRPDPSEVVAALALAEKQSKKAKQRYAYEDLVGSWQLGFVSGTRKVPSSRPGAQPLKQPGKGRFLPRWIDITITYGSPQALLSLALLTEEASDQQISAVSNDSGAVVNRVGLGGVSLQLSGPTRYWPNTYTLVFDFVYLQGGIGPVTLYDGPVRGGVARAKAFVDAGLKDQAFFTFFAVQPHYIAARGKGGGLALWTRVTPL